MINGELIDLVAGDYEARIASSGAMLVHLRHQGRDLIMPFDAEATLPAGWQGAEHCEIQGGETIAIWGAGPVGQFCIRSAVLLGARQVVCIDRVPERLEMARAGGAVTIDNVLLSEEGRLARQQVSVREHAPAVCLSSTSIQAAPADPEELSAIANTGSSRRASRRGPHRPQHEMSIQAGDPSIVYRVVVLTPSRLC